MTHGLTDSIAKIPHELSYKEACTLPIFCNCYLCSEGIKLSSSKLIAFWFILLLTLALQKSSKHSQLVRRCLQRQVHQSMDTYKELVLNMSAQVKMGKCLCHRWVLWLATGACTLSWELSERVAGSASSLRTLPWAGQAEHIYCSKNRRRMTRHVLPYSRLSIITLPDGFPS